MAREVRPCACLSGESLSPPECQDPKGPSTSSAACCAIRYRASDLKPSLSTCSAPSLSTKNRSIPQSKAPLYAVGLYGGKSSPVAAGVGAIAATGADHDEALAIIFPKYSCTKLSV